MSENTNPADQSQMAAPRPKTPNDNILRRVSHHPMTQFDERVFVDLLEHSLSLSTFEKKRVVDNVPHLSQSQINELLQVFEDERVEFRKLITTEANVIKWLVIKAQNEWEKLKDIYLEEEQAERERQKNEQLANAKAEEDAKKVEEIRKSLGL